MTKNEFDEKKAAVLEKVMPHFAAPGRFDLPKLSREETALLMSAGPGGLVTKSSVAKIEKAALLKLKNGYARIGVHGVADLVE